MTTHTRQLQQYTQSTNNNYTKDNLKLATKHMRQIRIQRVQKVKDPSMSLLCTVRVRKLYTNLALFTRIYSQVKVAAVFQKLLTVP